MHLRPYLNFDGTCAEAMAFYQSVLGGKLDVMRFKDVPEMPCPPEAGERVMHAHLDSKGHSLMASDTMPGQPYSGMTGFGDALAFDTVADADKTLDSHGVKLVVDQMSLMYLMGTEVDYVEGLQGAGFKFNNPITKSTCGCGSSFSA